jgi:hypothetical protein
VLAQRTLVALEVALCLVLLVGAGLLSRSFRRVIEVDPGFRRDGLVTMRIALPINYDSDAVVNRFYRELQKRLTALPGVAAVTLVRQLPISGGEGNGDLAIEGRPSAEGELGASTVRGVLPNYFAIMGIPLVKGRMLDERDNASSLHPVLIDASFAPRSGPHADPLGQRFKVGPRDRAAWLTIVGVVGDVRQIGLDSAAPLSTYKPLVSDPYSRFEVAMRVSGSTSGVMAAVLALWRSGLRSRLALPRIWNPHGTRCTPSRCVAAGDDSGAGADAGRYRAGNGGGVVCLAAHEEPAIRRRTNPTLPP